jgi:hypothetical protein
MGFTIESQGGNTLSAHDVLNTLVHAASSNQEQVRAGTAQLQIWEKQGMYHSFLQVSFASPGSGNIKHAAHTILLKHIGCLP